ncbi:MAG: aminoglycoside phosphotransferase family protein [Dorea sp.]|nr:aminoglycoside phosphotransferase family protein [Dorea sp.]
MSVNVRNIVDQFNIEGSLTEIIPWGNGLMNATFRVKTTREDYLLQRMNESAYPDIPAMIDNIQMVTEWIRKSDYYFSDGRKKPTLCLILGKNGGRFIRMPDGSSWRMYNFMKDTFCIEMVESYDQAYKLGETLGRFQYRLHDFPVYQMHVTVKDFHNPWAHYLKLMKTVGMDPLGRVSEVKEELEFIRRARRWIEFDFFKREVESGRIPLRANHNDTKINNILFDRSSGESIFMVDLDTLMPGIVAWDFGDAIRSCMCTGKDRLEGAGTFDRQLYDIYKKGFLDGARGVLTKKEEDTLDKGAILIVLESAMRYLEDYLNGDTYLKTSYPGQNLVKARMHMKLAEEMMLELKK